MPPQRGRGPRRRRGTRTASLSQCGRGPSCHLAVTTRRRTFHRKFCLRRCDGVSSQSFQETEGNVVQARFRVKRMFVGDTECPGIGKHTTKQHLLGRSKRQHNVDTSKSESPAGCRLRCWKPAECFSLRNSFRRMYWSPPTPRVGRVLDGTSWTSNHTRVGPLGIQVKRKHCTSRRDFCTRRSGGLAPDVRTGAVGVWKWMRSFQHFDGSWPCHVKETRGANVQGENILTHDYFRSVTTAHVRRAGHTGASGFSSTPWSTSTMQTSSVPSSSCCGHVFWPRLPATSFGHAIRLSHATSFF